MSPRVCVCQCVGARTRVIQLLMRYGCHLQALVSIQSSKTYHFHSLHPQINPHATCLRSHQFSSTLKAQMKSSFALSFLHFQFVMSLFKANQLIALRVLSGGEKVCSQYMNSTCSGHIKQLLPRQDQHGR